MRATDMAADRSLTAIFPLSTCTAFEKRFLPPVSFHPCASNPAAAVVNRRPAPGIRVAIDPRLIRPGSFSRIKKPKRKEHPMTSPSNAERGSGAEQLLIAYAHREGRTGELAGSQSAETLLTDLLADFMHYATAMRMDFRNCIDVAQMHFDAEIAEAT
jgi:hypothetical protein